MAIFEAFVEGENFASLDALRQRVTQAGHPSRTR